MNRTLTAAALGLTAALSVQPVAALSHVEATAAKKAALIERMHTKARKAIVNAAQDGTFAEYLHADDEAHRHEAKKRVDEISLNVQSKFHVEEMCLIDADGPELARIVGNEIANDLSPDESGAVFFAPTFALGSRNVFVSPIYMSPDADKWVIAYATPIVVGAEKKAILHYEHDMGVYQQTLNKDTSGSDRFVVAVNEDGWVVSDSRAPVAYGKRGDSESPGDYFARFDLGGKGLGEVVAAIDRGEEIEGAGDQRFRAAYRKAGRWTILVFEDVLRTTSN